MSAARNRNWLFTLNNPEPNESPELWDHDSVRFIAFQLERGENGTPHFQGYLIVPNALSLAGVKRKFSNRAHWEIRSGSHEQALTYVTKAETRINDPVVWGEPPRQGHRSDLLSVKERLDSGASNLDIANDFFGPWVRYHRAFATYRLLRQPPRQSLTQVHVIWGPTGTGKSSVIHAACPKAYWKPNSKWWDGYEGQEQVVLDEFYGWLPYDFMLRLCDQFPLNVETKGGTTAFTSKQIWITSNQHPSKWYKNLNFAPLRRRFTTLVYKGDLQSPGVDELLCAEFDIDNPPLRMEPTVVVNTQLIRR